MKSILFFLLSVTMHTLIAQTLVDFPNQPSFKNWQIVNDDVMGGISNSKMYLNEENRAVFEGRVSLENYGGFCSVRHDLKRNTYPRKNHPGLKIKRRRQKLPTSHQSQSERLRFLRKRV